MQHLVISIIKTIIGRNQYSIIFIETVIQLTNIENDIFNEEIVVMIEKTMYNEEVVTFHFKQ